MADRADKAAIARPVEPGMIFRAVRGVREIVRNVETAWFGPLNPIQPAAQTVVGRQMDYPYGVNLDLQPRAREAITFEMLRSLADSYDLLRLVIETRKDQMSRLEWNIKPREPLKKPDKRCEEVQAFFSAPDREHTWQEWLRLLLEDLLVVDAACVYPRLTRMGTVHAFEIMDGTTIKRVINKDGRTPEPPDVAYQQILKGIPAVDYSRDELVYRPRNLRSNRFYGYSPVEQVIMTVNIALRRQLNQLSYYTEGNTPNLLIKTPKEWPPDAVAQFQKAFDELTQGKSKHRAIFIPDGTDPVDTQAASLTDMADEWLARVVCFAFSVSPMPFIKMMNRGTADTAKETAAEEGIEPMMIWVTDFMNMLLWKYFGYTDLHFAWREEDSLSPKEQTEIDNIKLRNGTKSINEVRAGEGDDPIEGGDEYMIYTASGATLLDDVLNPPEPPEIAPTVPGAGGVVETTGKEKEKPAEKLQKKKILNRSSETVASCASRARGFTESSSASLRSKHRY